MRLCWHCCCRGCGGSGADTIEGGAGDDVLNGGDGIDTVSYASSTFGVTVHLDNPTPQNTVQQGVDTISGFENILGSSQADSLWGDAGNNVINGGAGFDFIVGGGGTNTLIGGDGGDTYIVQGLNDVVTEAVGGGYDFVLAQTNFTLAAGSEVEALVVDTTTGITLSGNDFQQVISGNAGNDTLSGGGGDDLIISGAGSNILIGGSGGDYYYTQGVNDVVTEAAGGGFDVVFAGGNLTLAAGSEVEVIFVNTASGVTIIGSDSQQTLIGNAGNDTLSGGGGNDVLISGAGTNTLIGGADSDFYYTQGVNDVVTEAAGGGFDVVVTSGDLTLAAGSEVEVIFVGALAGVTITGSDSAQTILGSSGDDRFIGGLGVDALTGSGGADTYVLRNTFDDRDFITDFATGTDKLEISASLFGGGLTAGSLSASQFLSGAGVDAATTADQRFIYNSSTGNLWFDADGSGTGASTIFANLLSTPPLTAADFLIAA